MKARARPGLSFTFCTELPSKTNLRDERSNRGQQNKIYATCLAHQVLSREIQLLGIVRSRELVVKGVPPPQLMMIQHISLSRQRFGTMTLFHLWRFD